MPTPKKKPAKASSKKASSKKASAKKASKDDPQQDLLASLTEAKDKIIEASKEHAEDVKGASEILFQSYLEACDAGISAWLNATEEAANALKIQPNLPSSQAELISKASEQYVEYQKLSISAGKQAAEQTAKFWSESGQDVADAYVDLIKVSIKPFAIKKNTNDAAGK